MRVAKPIFHLYSNGETYITTTTKGDELCTDFLMDFITLARIPGESSGDDRFTRKGVNAFILSQEASEYFRGLLGRIGELNSDSEEESNI